MFDSIFTLLALLFVKHWYVDFVNQNSDEMLGKGVYGNAHGIMHSVKHGVGTFIIMWMFVGDWPFAFTIAAMDFALHYHIDWIKVRWGSKDIYSKAFWSQFGLDQLAHSLTYLLLVWLAV